MRFEAEGSSPFEQKLGSVYRIHFEGSGYGRERRGGGEVWTLEVLRDVHQLTLLDSNCLWCSPPRSESRTRPLSRAISSTSGRGRPLSVPFTLLIRSLSLLPKLTVHLFSLVLRNVPSSVSSGP